MLHQYELWVPQSASASISLFQISFSLYGVIVLSEFWVLDCLVLVDHSGVIPASGYVDISITVFMEIVSAFSGGVQVTSFSVVLVVHFIAVKFAVVVLAPF
jgi:hypothetical protein